MCGCILILKLNRKSPGSNLAMYDKIFLRVALNAKPKLALARYECLRYSLWDYSETRVQILDSNLDAINTNYNDYSSSSLQVSSKLVPFQPVHAMRADIVT